MIPTIKSRMTCVEYAKRAGLPIVKSGDRCVSPLRSTANNKTAFVVYDDFFYDFVSQHGGDVIDLCALLKHDGDKRSAIRELAMLTGTETVSSRNWVKATSQLNNLIQLWHESLTPGVVDYLHSRRISDETIKKFKLGYTGTGEQDGYAAHRISIPYWKNGYIYSYAARSTRDGQEPKYLKRRNDDLSDRSAPWGMHTLSSTDRPLVIAEGAFDALSFAQEGYPVLATMGGHFSRDQIATVISAARNYPYVCLTFDADGPGADFTINLARILFKHRIKFLIAHIPRPHKDVSDYYAEGNSLPALIASAKDGTEILAMSIKDESEFKAFAYEAARYVEPPELARLFSAVRSGGIFDDAWLAALQKSCERPPSEDMVAKKITARHMLRYLENVGFYEYKRGVWNRIEETQVQGYIGDELGRHRTGGKMVSILRVIKTDTYTTEPFDRKPVFNFINGTLELSANPVFREHRPDDLCSIQAPYPYDPSAHSDDWNKFISDVSADDSMREQLLQEIAGYVLFPNCSLERMFVLQGSGGNGKSVYINLLEAVYGHENTSHVTVTGICADFQRIYLSTSLLNIATEIKANLSGAEEYLKQIASGETISACYKGKNFVQFKPRCKMIFAVNGQIKSQDTSDGLTRRLTIVNFTQSFVDYPEAAHERKRDVELVDKLMKQLPAIFNWCLQGYIMLMNTKTFTETEDEVVAKQEFREASNPLLTFVRETDFGTHISKTELRDMWKEWATENGHHVGSSTRLYREIKRLLPEGTKEVATRINGENFKGWIFPQQEDNCSRL